MSKKLTDKEKVIRVNSLIIEAINVLQSNDKGRWGVIETKLYQSFAVLQSDKDDEFMITSLWIQLQHGHSTQRQLVLSEQKNTNAIKKSGK
jgi:hypothetical protein